MSKWQTHTDHIGHFAYTPASPTATPFFSVIMGAYNAETTLAASLDSLLQQSFVDFEIIVINDGSSDGTEALLADYAARDARLGYVNQDNIGLTKSLNRAIRLARGQYLVRQDADDDSQPERLAALYEGCATRPDVLFSQAIIIDQQQRHIATIPFLHHLRQVDSVIKYGNIFAHGTLAFRADLLKSEGYDEQFRYAQDYELILRLLQQGRRFFFVNQPLYTFYIREGSIGNARSAQQTALARQALRKHRGTDRYMIVGKPRLLRGLLKLLAYAELWLRNQLPRHDRIENLP
ncbi:glycosyltransferase [Pokkaliibacter sp. MBI-7]|uniref:glycosyltransferase family 2 protein n=1 Tax=Pokkaliibacter sp. MBI-7 TaxID=3040600 RepID=UPI00244A948B|nr:glycosyltransferase [Pokkaliibacter sp. MBI-7]MDH2432993.1 glycosyltransferase [Pokkaliibacter sp. MBI-7]